MPCSLQENIFGNRVSMPMHPTKRLMENVQCRIGREELSWGGGILLAAQLGIVGNVTVREWSPVVLHSDFESKEACGGRILQISLGATSPYVPAAAQYKVHLCWRRDI